MDETKLRLSYSKAMVFLNCRQRYKWIYVEDLTPIMKEQPLQIGLVTHKLREKWIKGTLKISTIENLKQEVQKEFPSNENEVSQIVALEAASLFNHYVQNFTDDFELISPEMHLEYDFGDFILYSRLDGLAKDKQGIWRDELKTASKMDSHYLQGQHKGLQTSIAHILLDQLTDFNVKGTMFEILVKTKIPQYHHMPIFKDRWQMEYAMKTIEGIVRSINHGDFYPSSQCHTFNRPCEFEMLCKNDTPERRATFYQSYSKQKGGKSEIKDDSENG